MTQHPQIYSRRFSFLTLSVGRGDWAQCGGHPNGCRPPPFDQVYQRTMTRLRTTTGLRTTARLRTTTTAGSTIAAAVPAEDVARAPGASIGPAAYVSELATASPATRFAASLTSPTGRDFCDFRGV